MPQVIKPPTRTMPPALLPRIRRNVKQFESLSMMGLLPEKGYELIEGDIIMMVDISPNLSPKSS